MTATTKLTTEQIFDRIRSLMCQITSPNGVTSGILITPSGYVLSVMHNIPQVQGEGGMMMCTLDKVQLLYKQMNIKPQFPKEFLGENGYRLDLSILQTGINIDSGNCIRILPDSFQLREGMKVYFAGFPLTQSSITFHKGIISSISEEGVRRFTIAGTVVPGNSGGPVLIQHDGNLYIAGIITSEVADLDPEFLFIEDSFKVMRNQGGVGGMAIGLQYPDGQVRSTSPLDLIGMALSVVKKNMSTGIGRAIDARHLKDLFSGIVAQSPSTGDLLVKKPVKGEYAEGKTIIMKYMEHFPGNPYGAGPRGVRINHKQIDGPRVYLFDLNPHDIKKYNKNQNELYQEAARAFLEAFSQRNEVPDNFTFSAYGLSFVATLQS